MSLTLFAPNIRMEYNDLRFGKGFWGTAEKPEINNKTEGTYIYINNYVFTVPGHGKNIENFKTTTNNTMFTSRRLKHFLSI